MTPTRFFSSFFFFFLSLSFSLSLSLLFVSQLPSSVTEESLSTLFAQNEGFKEVRIVPGRPDIAFVEYASSAQADQARMVLNGCQITPDQAMRVEFARR
ncbi:hypothetical protein O5D80_007900 [Batrachochytrium dendrobatidis]|nr:hypothetical protein O5D80_007900 [Batrachochytrium dendrobatidis]